MPRSIVLILLAAWGSWAIADDDARLQTQRALNGELMSERPDSDDNRVPRELVKRSASTA